MIKTLRSAALAIATIPMVAIGSPAWAEVVVEIFAEPLVERFRTDTTEKEVGGLTAPPPSDRGITSAYLWYAFPLNADTTSLNGERTLIAVRCGDTSATSVVEYYDVFFALQRTDTIPLAANQVTVIDVRNVGGLPKDPDGHVRGFVRITADGAVSVDAIQTNSEQHLASGDTMYVIEDFCSNWEARFQARLPPSSDIFADGFETGDTSAWFAAAPTPTGSIFSFIVDGPMGSESTDPPTIIGDVYTEGGAYVFSFTVRTDVWVFDLEILDFVPAGMEYGSVELVVNSLFSPTSLLSITHRGVDSRLTERAFCADPP